MKVQLNGREQILIREAFPTLWEMESRKFFEVWSPGQLYVSAKV